MEPEDYKHRDKDEHGNPDDFFTEKEAVKMARNDGIEFIDEWLVMTGPVPGGEALSVHSSQNKAQQALEKANDPDAHIVQTRRRK